MIVSIQRVATGEARVIIAGVQLDEGDLFNWFDGNMSCDCNRAIDFERVGEINETLEIECGRGAYRVIISDDAGKVIREDPLPSPECSASPTPASSDK